MMILDSKKTFFSSDQHFFHKNVIKYDDRPYCCVWHMNQSLVSNINETVGESGTMIFLGDISFGNKNQRKKILGEIKCRKVVILGNHDATAKSMKEAGVDEVYAELEVEIDHKRVYMSHIPNREKAKLYDIHLHGHVHTAWVRKENMINVGCCVWDYKPQLFKTLVEQSNYRQSQLKNPGHQEDNRDERALMEEICKKSKEE